MSWKKRIGRRAFMRGGLATALASPILARRTEAQRGARPRALIFCYQANGVENEYDRQGRRWGCTGGERDFELLPLLQRFEADLPSGVPARDKMVFFSGVYNSAIRGDHASHETFIHSFLRSRQRNEDGASIDQFIAERLDGYPERDLRLDIRASKVPFTDARGRQLGMSRDPRTVYDTITRATSGGGDDAARAHALRRRRSSLSFIRDQLRDLQRELCGEERELLEANLSTVESMEGSLEQLYEGGATCGSATMPSNPHMRFGQDDAHEHDSRIHDLAGAQIANVVAAVSCGIAPVIDFGLAGDDRSDNYEFLGDIEGRPFGGGFSGHNHSFAHDKSEPTITRFYEQREYWNDQYRRVLHRLDAIPAGGGRTLLDECIVVHINEMFYGEPHGGHALPFLVAGGGAGQIETGRYLDYDHAEASDLYVSLARLMGLRDVESFGRNASGPLAGFADV